MKTLTSKHVVFCFDCRDSPVVTIEPPENLAVEEMISRLVEREGISHQEACMLISIAGDARLDQTCNSPLGRI